MRTQGRTIYAGEFNRDTVFQTVLTIFAWWNVWLLQ
jgi:hypothetical protein